MRTIWSPSNVGREPPNIKAPGIDTHPVCNIQSNPDCSRQDANLGNSDERETGYHGDTTYDERYSTKTFVREIPQRARIFKVNCCLKVHNAHTALWDFGIRASNKDYFKTLKLTSISGWILTLLEFSLHTGTRLILLGSEGVGRFILQISDERFVVDEIHLKSGCNKSKYESISQVMNSKFSDLAKPEMLWN